MKIYNKKLFLIAVLIAVFTFSCKDLDELNINPNGVSPESARPKLLFPTILTSVGQTVVNLGYGDLAGVMQHTQKDGWGGGHNSYDWNDQRWSGPYGILRNIDEMYRKSEELGLDFYKGTALVMKAYVFGLITDLWGDAPFTDALKGDRDAEEFIKPKFDTQQFIYHAILDDLEQANVLLSKNQDDYVDVDPVQDVIYHGDAAKWRKFANSLALRYYMRLSIKEPDFAKAGIEKIAGDPEKYPLIVSADDDANMDYIGSNSGDSWPNNTVFDGTNGSNFRRIKMCKTLVDAMKALDDPRLGVWAAPVEIPLVIDPNDPDRDEIVDGKRYVGKNVTDEYFNTFGIPVDTSSDFVGMPPAWSQVPQAFNLSPDLNQAAFNPHVSWLNDRYRNASGPLLKSRMLTAAEVHFILAEAALRGMAVGDAQAHYEAGIRESFNAWGVSDQYDDYIQGGAAFNNTIEQVMEQKWIASWTAAAEAWFDYRRTGLPDLHAGPYSKRSVLPVRFMYSIDEQDLNPDNTREAINRLEDTQYRPPDDLNSSWAKPWVLQGTGMPWN